MTSHSIVFDMTNTVLSLDINERLAGNGFDIDFHELLNNIVGLSCSIISAKQLHPHSLALMHVLLSRLPNKMSSLSMQLSQYLLSYAYQIDSIQPGDQSAGRSMVFVCIGKCLSLQVDSDDNRALIESFLTYLMSQVRSYESKIREDDTASSIDVMMSLKSSLIATHSFIKGLVSVGHHDHIDYPDNNTESIVEDDNHSQSNSETSNPWISYQSHFILILSTIFDAFCNISMHPKILNAIQSIISEISRTDKYLISLMNILSEIFKIVSKLLNFLPNHLVLSIDTVSIPLDYFIFDKLCILQGIYGSHPCSYDILGLIHTLIARYDNFSHDIAQNQMKYKLIESTIRILQQCLYYLQIHLMSDDVELYILGSLRLCKQWCMVDADVLVQPFNHGQDQINSNSSIAQLYHQNISLIIAFPSIGYTIDPKIIRMIVSSFQMISSTCSANGFYHIIIQSSLCDLCYHLITWLNFGMNESYQRTYSLILEHIFVNIHHSLSTYFSKQSPQNGYVDPHEYKQTYLQEVLIAMVVDVCGKIYHDRKNGSNMSLLAVRIETLDSVMVFLQERLVDIVCNQPTPRKTRSKLLDTGNTIRKKISE